MSDRLFRDRRDAGQALARLLADYRDDPRVLVLGVPRGGVAVAYEVATALGAPLDVFAVRKLGAPGREELAMGAVASRGVTVVNDDVVRGLDISPQVLQRAAEREARELARRERLYRQGRPMPEVAGRTVILVDDGLATGASMRAAIRALQELRPGRVVVAVPAAPESTCAELSLAVDEVVCATTPTPFSAVGTAYQDFAQTTDDEVRGLMRAAEPPTPAHAPTAVAAVRAAAQPVENGVPSEQTLLDLVGDAHLVLIGEASHGTHEFYAARAAMTRTLIEQKGFNAVAIEGDWPDAYRVNRFVRGRSDDDVAEEALRGFQRFPTWMWRNTVVLDFVGWLREHNDRLARDVDKTGFYGLDLYSLHRSIEAVISYLESTDPEAASRAKKRYACFDHYRSDDGQSYGFAAAFGAGQTCEDEVIAQLQELRQAAPTGDLLAEDEHFYAEMNARTVRNAAEYYRAMFGSSAESWNLRDRHMAHTLDALAGHLSRRRGEPAKVVVWAHNSHLGDARVTDLAARGELNLGQLVRERHRGDSRSIGFSTYAGTVTAADDWGGPAQRKRVRPGMADSIEELGHDVGDEGFWLDFRAAPKAADALRAPMLERAIGVVYRPRTERQSHYFHARVPDQFDALIHLDDTRALEPLERTARWTAGEVPETYPSAI